MQQHSDAGSIPCLDHGEQLPQLGQFIKMEVGEFDLLATKPAVCTFGDHVDAVLTISEHPLLVFGNRGPQHGLRLL
jgi:hypothetical protein